MTNPCLHDGKCIDAYSGFQWSFGPLQYYCLCKPPYKGIRCEGKWQASEAASRGFYEKVVLKNFPIFTGKHLCRSLFSIKVAGLQACSIFRRGFQHRCFPVNIAKFLRTPILNICKRLLLKWQNSCLHDGKCIDAYSHFQWSFGPLQYYCLCKPPCQIIRCKSKWQVSEAASMVSMKKLFLKISQYS